MKREYLKALVVLGFFITVTGVTMGSLNKQNHVNYPIPPQGQNLIFSDGDGPLVLSGHLVQDKIFSGGDGIVSLSLTMSVADMLASDEDQEQHVDMVIVLDQSGSMQGHKIEYARQAVLNLLSGLSDQDRFAMIGYANGVWRYADLTNVTEAHRETFQSLIHHISPGGNTNLGAGLQEGIQTLLTSQKNGNVEKVMLISDGLANRGIIDPDTLGNIASIAVEQEFSISTVGVGDDFNEQLMATLADRGAGNYYYLENPRSFVDVFLKEFHHSKTVAARAVEINIPLPKGVSLLNASGYPVTITDNRAIVHPGDLRSGQTRKLFLTLKFPTYAEEMYEISGIAVQYLYQGNPYAATTTESFRIACVNDPNEAVASIERSEWEEKVLQEDFNALRERVALDLKNGKKHEALQQIEGYYTQQQRLNTAIGSDKVTTHLNEELDELRDFVEQTFSGSPQEIEKQQKANAKDLQFRGYKERRAQR